MYEYSLGDFIQNKCFQLRVVWNLFCDPYSLLSMLSMMRFWWKAPKSGVLVRLLPSKKKLAIK